MVKPLIVVAALLLAATAARPDGVKLRSFGDGGGYTHPDPATQQFLDGDAQNPPPAAAAAATVSPVPTPSPAFAAAPVPNAPAAPAAPSAATSPSRPASAAVVGAPRRESLWNGVVTPLAVAPGLTSDDPDTARAAADSDYSARVFGQAPVLHGPRVVGPGAAPAPAANSALSAAPGVKPAEGRLFVSLVIDPREAGTLRDAVAGLGAAAGFAADNRFEPTSGADGMERITGWIPVSRLGAALQRPGVRSVRVDPVRLAPAAEATARFLVGLRVTDPGRAAAEVETELRDMASSAGFRATRVVGLETAPDGSAVALVEGRLALARLAQVLDRDDVARIEPLLPAPAPVPARTAVPGSLAGFARFASERGLWLILVTLLLALPSLRSGVGRLSAIFNPYR